MSPHIGHLTLDRPRIVGCINDLATFPNTALPSTNSDFDFLEIRMRQDDTDFISWRSRLPELRATGAEIILVLRHASEGGTWTDDARRLTLYAEALDHGIAALDVETNSAICEEVVRLAHTRPQPAPSSSAPRAAVIGSFHDFSRTPPAADLAAVLSTARARRVDVAKFATMTHVPADIWPLLELLRPAASPAPASPAPTPNLPICAMGMGPLGSSTRVTFPALGSWLTYAYLDKPTAPGQLSCIELAAILRTLNLRS